MCLFLGIMIPSLKNSPMETTSQELKIALSAAFHRGPDSTSSISNSVYSPSFSLELIRLRNGIVKENRDLIVTSKRSYLLSFR